MLGRIQAVLVGRLEKLRRSLHLELLELAPSLGGGHGSASDAFASSAGVLEPHKDSSAGSDLHTSEDNFTAAVHFL